MRQMHFKKVGRLCTRRTIPIRCFVLDNTGVLVGDRRSMNDIGLCPNGCDELSHVMTQGSKGLIRRTWNSWYSSWCGGLLYVGWSLKVGSLSMLTWCPVSLDRWMRLPRVQASGALQAPRSSQERMNVTVMDDLPCRPKRCR